MCPVEVSRRAVGRAAAWSAPAVVIAAAAPAHAASVQGTLKFNFLNAYGADYQGSMPTTIESQLSVQNVYTANGPVLTTLSVTLSYPADRVTGGAPTLVSGSPSWSYSGAVLTGGRWVYTFTFSGSVISGDSTSMLDVKVPLTSVTGSLTVQGTATASGFTGNATTATGL